MKRGLWLFGVAMFVVSLAHPALACGVNTPAAGRDTNTQANAANVAAAASNGGRPASGAPQNGSRPGAGTSSTSSSSTSNSGANTGAGSAGMAR